MRQEPWPVGTVLRYGVGPAALMVVWSVQPGYADVTVARYTGRHCYSHGEDLRVFHEDCVEATSVADLREWANGEQWTSRNKP